VAGLYVATDAEGCQRLDGRAIAWPLPAEDTDPVSPGETIEGEILLSTVQGLLGHLTERIYEAELLEPGSEDAAGAEPGLTIAAASARLLAPTPWSGARAARFAIACAEHVLGDAAGTELPGGTALADALAEAGAWLEEAVGDDAPGGALSRVRDLALLWRLRRRGKALGDLAFIELAGDIGSDVDALEDPVWSTVAAARDAVLAAVEAVQHAVFPRLSDLESHRYEKRERDVDEVVRFTGGRRLQPSWVPAWTAADDAAERARQAAGEADGGEAQSGEAQSGEAQSGEAQSAEAEWQAAQLEEALR